jgi:Rps23 Pro-64 3,4-dihydroxylase Tpa1-like proline 4-hydroxylase
MQVTQRGRHYVVIDDFLDDAALSGIRDVMNHSKFSESILLSAQDGAALRSRGTVIRGAVADEPTADEPTAGDPEAYRRILDAIAAEPTIFGESGADWNKVGFTFWNYPSGSKLGWHGDSGGGRQGSYILFLHDEWRASWGGELMILDERPDPGGDEAVPVEEQVRRSALSPIAVLPRPNRLVFLQCGTPHQVNRVDPTSERVRCSVTGHVIKKADGAGGDHRVRLRQFLEALEAGRAS